MISEQELMRREQFNDRLDVLKHVSDIKMRLKDDITTDFVLATLSEKDREAIIEMTGNAYFSKKLLDVIREKADKWEWNPNEKKYIKVKINEKDREEIKKVGQAIFDGYMVKIYMTVVLNRNIDKNYLIKVLSGYQDNEQETSMELNKNDLKSAMGELMADKSKEKEK